jgi:hypothetical protein
MAAFLLLVILILLVISCCIISKRSGRDGGGGGDSVERGTSGLIVRRGCRSLSGSKNKFMPELTGQTLRRLSGMKIDSSLLC